MTNGMTNKSPSVFYRTSSPLGPLPKNRGTISCQSWHFWPWVRLLSIFGFRTSLSLSLLSDLNSETTSTLCFSHLFTWDSPISMRRTRKPVENLAARPLLHLPFFRERWLRPKKQGQVGQLGATYGSSNDCVTDRPTNRPTNAPTDGPTDKAGYRGALSHLKTPSPHRHYIYE